MQKEADNQVIRLISLKSQLESQCSKTNELLGLIDHCGDEDSLSKLWAMSGLSRGEFARQPSSPSISCLEHELRKSPEFKMYKAHIWDIMNPESAMPPTFLKQSDEDQEKEEDLIYCNDIRTNSNQMSNFSTAFEGACEEFQLLFSKEAIFIHISMISNATCPVIGCSATVSKTTLQPEKEVQQKMDRFAIQQLLLKLSKKILNKIPF